MTSSGIQEPDADVPTAASPTAASPTGRTEGRQAYLRYLIIAFVVVVVPLTSHSPALPLVLSSVAAAVLVLVGRAPVVTALTLVSYALPSVVGAPWPSHCLLAAASWLVAGSSRSALRHRQLRAWRVRLSAVAVAVGVGTVAGIVVLIISRDAIKGLVIDLPVRLPTERGAVLAGVAVIALVNSLGEELWWRGFLFQETRPMRTSGQVAVQAITFGLAHWHGIPSGLAGAVAAAAYSAGLFFIRRRYGFLVCWTAHVLTDVIIFTAVTRWASFAWSG